jgi:hypothetical protein
MNKPDSPLDSQHAVLPKANDRNDTVDSREPYEAPRLESEELFEVLALACGKVNPTSLGCVRGILRMS